MLLILVYTQGIHIDIPIVSTRYRGFTAVYPIKLLYTSNIPVILASALLANAVFMGQMLWANYNPQNDNAIFNYIAQFDPGRPQTPTGGLLYYTTSPQSLDTGSARSSQGSSLYSVYDYDHNDFRETLGRTRRLVCQVCRKNLLDADVQVPGFRRAEGSVQIL